MEANSGERKRTYPGTSVGPRGGRPLLYGPTKESSRRVSQRRKDATKIFLLQCYVDWQLEKDLHQLSRNLKQMSNADFAEHLLADHAKRCKPNEDKQDAAMQTTNEGIRSVGTQTEEVQATSTIEAATTTLAKKAPTKIWPISPVGPATFPSQKDSVQRNTMTAFQDKNFEDDDFDEEEENQFEDWAEAVEELNQSEVPMPQRMTSFVKEEIDSDEDSDAMAALNNSGLNIKSGRGVIIKTEPSDTGYEIGDGDENDDEDDSDGEDKDDDREADEDGLSSMRNGECDKPLDTAEGDDTPSDDDSTDDVSVVIKLEPEDGSDESETELDEDGGAERVQEEEEEKEKERSIQDEDHINNGTDAPAPSENTRGLFKGGEIFQCEQCEKMYSSKAYLEMHQRTHRTKKKSCIYEICGRDAKNPSALVVHMRSHTKEKPFECIICGLHLATSHGLKRHVKLHSGEKPFKCQYCDRTFARSSGCKEHERRHTGERPFQCKYCSRTFVISGELKNHLKSKHIGDRPYCCRICVETFPTESEKDAHETCHDDDLSVVTFAQNLSRRCESCNCMRKSMQKQRSTSAWPVAKPSHHESVTPIIGDCTRGSNRSAVTYAITLLT